ncbi:MAG: sodium:proton antiporter, partial [Desulfitobacterium hafniense]
MEHSLGTLLPLYSVIPFVGMLLSIALGPVLFPKFWHHHFGKVSAAWAALLAVPLIVVYGKQGVDELLHLLIADYIPFIILIGSLFTVGGGILVRTSLKGTTWVNAGFLTIGAIVASWMGTTGAAMLLIRPFLRVNKDRKYKAFMVVFFIFMVANVGGSLTPLGDPPLFLGFLHGVPFFWTLRLITPMAVVLAGLLLMYIAFDKYYLAKEQKEAGLALASS